jgi:hypothetical protein
MANFNPKRFANIGALKAIQPQILREFLARFPEYFAGRTFLIDGDGSGLDYEALATALLLPDDTAPPRLIDALYLIDEMSLDEMKEALLDAIEVLPPGERAGLDDVSGLTASDLAVRVWLRAPALLEHQHEEQHVVSAARSFEHNLPKEPPPHPLAVPTAARLQAIEQGLATWFSKRGKGDLVRVFAYPRPDAVWFIVRRGETFRREPVQSGHESGSVFFRPEKHDVVVYVQSNGELRLNASSVRDKDQYRRLFGLHLFGHEDHFPAKGQKFTLDPLRSAGAESLHCADIEGIESIHLTELTFIWGGAHGEIEIRKADDLFEAFASRERELPRVPLGGAKFRVKFADSKTPRSVSVRPPVNTSLTRDDDSRLVEDWMQRRGFALTRRK